MTTERQLPSIVQLNVGGHFFTTSLQTLQADGESMLATMFSESSHFNLEVDSNGRYFIDRDGTHFRHVLNHLRGYPLELPQGAARRELMVEAEFYQLDGLVSALSLPQMPLMAFQDLGVRTRARRPSSEAASDHEGSPAPEDSDSGVLPDYGVYGGPELAAEAEKNARAKWSGIIEETKAFIMSQFYKGAKDGHAARLTANFWGRRNLFASAIANPHAFHCIKKDLAIRGLDVYAKLPKVDSDPLLVCCDIGELE